VKLTVLLAILMCTSCAVLPWPATQRAVNSPDTDDPLLVSPPVTLPAPPVVLDCSEEEAGLRRARRNAAEWRQYAEKLEKLLDIPRKAKP